ncbi:hypothetical protein S245_043159, partial [Arachis hypogaea]
GAWAKARVSWLLDSRALRQAGFTEQRTPLSPNSGGITSCCTTSLRCQACLSLEPSPFLLPGMILCTIMLSSSF